MSLISVKEEPVCSVSVSEAAARADLYIDHEVKNELVLGPVLMQPPDIAYKLYGQHKPKDVKQEPVDTTDTILNTGTFINQTVKVEPKWETNEWEDQNTQACTEQKIKQEILESAEDVVLPNGLHPKEEIQMKQETQNNLYSATRTSKNTSHEDSLLRERDDKVLLIKQIKTNKENTVVESPKISKLPQVLRSRSRIKYEEDSDTKHLEPVKRKQKKIHKCSQCGKTFSFRSSLTNHIRIHTGAKPYSCEICSKKFSDYAVLIRHRKVHTGDKPNICDICGNRYSEKYLLKNHMRVHTGEKVYFCANCPKTFINSSNYRRHLKVHMHKYSCDICKRQFGRKSLLASHIINHMKLKSNVCRICDKQFVQKSHLYRHMAVHNETRVVYACGICNKEFTQHGSLKKHVTRRVCEKRKEMLRNS